VLVHDEARVLARAHVKEIIELRGGDIYIMSEKAVGTDWKKKNVPTLRHSAGSPKYTN